MRTSVLIFSAGLMAMMTLGASAQTYDPGQAVQRGPFQNQVSGTRGVASGAVTNGGFETNGGAGTSTFTGWTVVDQTGGSGSWFVQTGTGSPLNGFTTPAPTEGAFAAMTDQTGPGSHVLYQDVTVPAAGGTLNFDLFIDNSASAFATPSPATLDFTVSPNQQFRMDIMNTTAGDFDVGAGVLANVFQTNPGDPLTNGGYVPVSFNLDAFAGQTVRLRFAEVDNQGFFNVGIDSVRIVAPPVAVPAFGPLGLIALILALALTAGIGLRIRAAG